MTRVSIYGGMFRLFRGNCRDPDYATVIREFSLDK